MSLEDESRRIVQELLAVFPDLEPEVRHDLDLVDAVAGAFALRLRDLICSGAGSSDERVRSALSLINALATRDSVHAQEAVAFGVMEGVMDFEETSPVAAEENVRRLPGPWAAGAQPRTQRRKFRRRSRGATRETSAELMVWRRRRV